MYHRAHLAELHVRLRSWEKTAEAVCDPDGIPDIVRRWRLVPRDRDLARLAHEWAATRSADLPRVDGRTCRRWANEQSRYATDADFDDDDWHGPIDERWPLKLS